MGANRQKQTLTMRTKRRLVRLAALVFVLHATCAAAPADARARDAHGAAPVSGEAAMRIFYSGHSLTDLPIPADVAAIAAARGNTIDWNRQHIAGSTIQQRAKGFLSGADAAGVDRDGRPIDIAMEFAGSPERPPYDVLVITEQHALLAALLWNDSVGQLRLFQDRFAEGGARGRTIFYEPWMSIDDKSDPARWIAYEKAAAPMWRCVVGGVNRSLAEASRPDRIVSLPAALALASLIESAPEGALPGARSPREAVELLISDDVHLTRLGAYFMALLVYGTIDQGPLSGAWAPDDVPAERALALQTFADRFLAGARDAPPPSLEECAARLETSFSQEFWVYFERARWRKEMGATAAALRLLQERARMRLRAWRGAENPFLLK